MAPTTIQQWAATALSLPRLFSDPERLALWAQKLGPYFLVELLLPGGTLIAMLLWLYRRYARPRIERSRIARVAITVSAMGLAACAGFPERDSQPEIESIGKHASEGSFAAPAAQWPAEDGGRPMATRNSTH